MVAVQGSVTQAVAVENVTRQFGAVRALDGVSLEVMQGEFVSLLGPSGCGKTTLLRLIGGFERPDQGTVRLLGVDVTHQPPEQRRTNLVFQSLALFPHMSVAENVGFGLQMARVPAPEIARRVAAALAMVRLEGYGGRRVHQLSGGQRQRVAIARAVVNEPAVLLLDEPLGALDLRLRQELQDELRRLQRTLGSPFVFVTHDQTEAMALSDRVVVMRAGRIEQVATPRELYDRPATLFVAQFIGNSNLLDGVVTGRRGREIEIRWAGGLVTAESAGEQGERVTICIRHEATRLLPGDRGTVRDVVFLGPTVRATVALPDGATLVSERPVGRGEPVPQSGTPTGFGYDPAAVHVFRQETTACPA